jgi:MarR family transcriptional regulator, organic hydroperoxide resistance regulator
MAEYDENIGVLLAHICKAQRNLAEAAFNKLGLHVGQERVLLGLMDQESLGQSDLVTQLCVEPPTVTKMLQRMEKAGLVERRQDEQDGRAARVKVTARGRALQQPILQIWGDLEGRMLANMTMTEQTLLRRLLMQALANLTTLQDEG